LVDPEQQAVAGKYNMLETDRQGPERMAKPHSLSLPWHRSSPGPASTGLRKIAGRRRALQSSSATRGPILFHLLAPVG
jgi:hypothetical protein